MFPKLVFILLNTYAINVASTFLLIYLKLRHPLLDIKTVDERGLAFPITFVCITLLAASMLPILSNCIVKVRRDFNYSLCSFFLIPILTSFYIVLKFGGLNWITLVILIPFYCILTINFFYYRRSIT